MSNSDQSEHINDDNQNTQGASAANPDLTDTIQASAQAPDLQVVSAGASLTVENVANLRERILAAFEKAQNVTLGLSRVERIDLAGVHVLYAARREAEKRGKVFRMQGALHANVGEMLVTGGFCRTAPSDARELPDHLLEFAGRESQSEAKAET